MLDWQVHSGFPGVSEEALKGVYKSKEWDEPEECDEYRTDLVLGIMQKVKPKMSHEDAMAILVKGQQSEVHSAVAELQVDGDMIDDVMLPSDKPEVKKMIAGIEQASEKTKLYQSINVAAVTKYFGESKVKKGTAPPPVERQERQQDRRHGGMDAEA